jgi:formate dehydrogenase subunit gamma
VVQLCRAEACQARGAEALAGHVRHTLGCDFHGTSADGRVTLEPVYCLGHCAVGPNIAIDDKPYARVSSARFDALLDACGGER